jgi:hypothetical protein
VQNRRANKKTRKREKYLENIKKAHRKKKKKDKAPQFNFSALHLIHDPQVGGFVLILKFVILKLMDKAPQLNFSALHLIHDPQVPVP